MNRGQNDFTKTGSRVGIRSKWLRMGPNTNSGAGTTGLTTTFTWNNQFF
jgi:hypothetical protein